MDFFSILTLIGGLALFLYGMDTMGDGLKRLAGGKLEAILSRLTSNRFKGFLLGLIVTSIIQSSSATTVMLVGFVNSGIMKLGQTVSIILGANVGTTVTSWLLSLTGISGSTFWLRIFKPESFTPVLALVGVIMLMMCKSDNKKNIATILMGFAVLMFGMETMSGSMDGLKDSPAFAQMMIMFSNPIMGILMGTVLTAIIQSSSASVGILQALALTVAIPGSTALPIILGQNIGTTITPILSSISGNREAKRTAFMCLYIKVINVIVICPIFYILHSIFNFAFMSESVTVLSIALIHTIFNIISAVMMIPFCKWIEKFTVMTIRGKEEKGNEELDVLDDRFLTIPAFAIEKCNEKLREMALIAKKSVESSTALLDRYDDERAREIADEESLVDKYEDKLGVYLVKLAKQQTSENESREITRLLHVIGDVERISDHAVSIMSASREMNDKEISFSDEAMKELSVVTGAVIDILNLTVDALINRDIEKAMQVEPLEQIIDRLKHKIKKNHIKRLQDGSCTVELGFILSDLLTNYGRVSDHCSNIAVQLLSETDEAFEGHEYMRHVKKDGENQFFEQYENLKSKYVL